MVYWNENDIVRQKKGENQSVEPKMEKHTVQE